MTSDWFMYIIAYHIKHIPNLAPFEYRSFLRIAIIVLQFWINGGHCFNHKMCASNLAPFHLNYCECAGILLWCLAYIIVYHIERWRYSQCTWMLGIADSIHCWVALTKNQSLYKISDLGFVITICQTENNWCLNVQG